MEAEHEAKLRNIHDQTERLRQREQRLLQVRPWGKRSERGGRGGCVREKHTTRDFLQPPSQERTRVGHLQDDPERLRPNAAMASTPRRRIPADGPGEVNSV